MDLAQWQTEVDAWIKRYGVRYFDQMTNTLLLVEEVGELARIVARHFGEQSFKPDQEPKQIKTQLADEMADVLFVLTCLANQCGINLEEAVVKNMEKKTKRDGQRHHSNPKLRS